VIFAVFFIAKGSNVLKQYHQMRWILCGYSYWHETTLDLSYERIPAQLNTDLIVSIYNFYHSHIYEVSPSS